MIIKSERKDENEKKLTKILSKNKHTANNKEINKSFKNIQCIWTKV